MTAQPQRYITEQEYLEVERTSTSKHEYLDGQIYAMSGASRIHNLIAGNTLAALHGQLRQKPCQIFPSDMRIRVMRTGLNTYPDLVIMCGEPEYTDDALDTLTNPLVLIEILSPSTERYDRGMKAQHYRTIETLQDYILIAQDYYHIEHYSRQANGQWLLEEAIGLEAQITIGSIACSLALADVYEKVGMGW
ncbi:Uma2 family endonuclease [Candidatus Oscillochloris fontis]|uniref:Uma2 family endonuclease n=1 Tax=Candidatus Oscillochloris fontis TaxID=2496868 RepID=UPI00101D0975|nr:Uma2 family endonuclease [Candidatus Oscillochloris fontis]